MAGFSNSLRSLMQGGVSVASYFDGFIPVASNLQEEIVAAHRKEVVEEA